MHKSEMCPIKCHYYQFNLISDQRADNQTCRRTDVRLAITISKTAIFFMHILQNVLSSKTFHKIFTYVYNYINFSRTLDTAIISVILPYVCSDSNKILAFSS